MLNCVVILLILLGFAQSSTYILSQEFFSEGFTNNDFNLWNSNGASMPMIKFSNCSSHRIFGGYNVFVGDPTSPNNIYRSWTNLIPHYSITVSLKLYKIDSWVNNTVFFMVDGVTAQLYTFTAANGGTTDFCGNPTPVADSINTSFNDLIVPVSFTVSHTASSFTLKMISNLMSSSGSWGIRDLNITIAACDQSCLTCSSSTACTSCDISYGLVLSGSFCVCSSGLREKYIPCSTPPCAVCLVGSCSGGYYYSTTTTYCEPCNVACSTCTSPVNSAATCSSCNNNGFVGNPHVTACFSCFSGCLTCTTTASTSCLTCSYGYFFSSSTSTCVQSCPAGTYGEEKTAYCYPCSSPCATCLGNNGGSYYCLSCVAGKYFYGFACYTSCPNSLLGYQGGCVSSCPSTTYADSSTLTCLSCVSNCLECTNGTGCFICSSGSYMYSGLCYTSCPVTFYGDNQTQLCLSCHTSCLTCNGPFSDNCLSCPGTVLISSVCYTTCPSNTYSAVCLACDQSCLTCTGPSSSNCVTCSSPLFYHLNFSSCLATCNLGELSNNYNFTCTKCAAGKVAYFEQCQTCSSTCLECNGISFLECTSCPSGTTLVRSTCVLSGESTVIFTPSSAGSSIRGAFMTVFLIHFFLCLFLEVAFQYKTNLMATIELLQILSYTQFLTIQLSESTQRLAHFLYLTNFAAFLSPISVTAHPSLPAKFNVMGKSGYFLADAFGIQMIMLLCGLLYLGVRYLSKRSDFFLKVYHKINPYILTYTFRLIILELALDTMLYIYCFDVTSGAGVGSLVLLLADLALLVASICWRIKTEQDGTQIALFYCNQMGEAREQEAKEHLYLPTEEPTPNSLQEKIKKNKILPSVMELLLKVPVAITILYFIDNASTQTICFFIYFSFYLLLVALIPIRRKVYRWTMLTNSVFLLLNALGGLLVSKAAASSGYFDGIWLTVLTLLFAVTLMQAISNYHYFLACLSYLRHRLRTGGDEANLQNESQSNLTSQEDQSVIFQKREHERQLKPQGDSHSKLVASRGNVGSWRGEE